MADAGYEDESGGYAEIVETEPTKEGGQAEAPLVTNATSMFWGIQRIRAQGTFVLNFFFADPVIVRSDSQVAVSITEVQENGTPFLGNAHMWIMNVVPLADGTIFVRGAVAWEEPLLCNLNFIIVN